MWVSCRTQAETLAELVHLKHDPKGGNGSLFNIHSPVKIDGTSLPWFVQCICTYLCVSADGDPADGESDATHTPRQHHGGPHDQRH